MSGNRSIIIIIMRYLHLSRLHKPHANSLTYLLSIAIDNIPCNIPTIMFSHNYLMQEFPSGNI